jgi:glycosyltransferase involved in cell wall biosynthesis
VALAPRTQDVLAEAFGVPRGRLRVIPNGADGAVFTRITSDERSRARAHLGVAEDARLALYLGALSAEKNVGVAIDAIGGLDDVCLVIAGDGPERERLAETAQRCAPARVIFVGRVDDPRTCYSAADVVVLPSRTEGMPAVLIEAGLCALPVVATDVGFVREIVVPGRTGVLVDVGDVESFRRAIERAVLDRDRLGREADRHCRARFTLARVANDWAELICEIAG